MLKNEKETYPRTEIVQVAMFRIEFSYLLTLVMWLIGSFVLKTDAIIQLVARQLKKIATLFAFSASKGY